MENNTTQLRGLNNCTDRNTDDEKKYEECGHQKWKLLHE
jgi:hypothetical protein